MEPVRNHRNPAVVEAARLHRSRTRRERAETLIEGPHLLSDARTAGVEVKRVFSFAEDASPGVIPVDARAMARLSGTDSPRGPVAVIAIPEPLPHHHLDMVVSWGVSDPGNVGTLIRVAASFGWAFGYMEGSADPWSPKVLRAGSGGQFQTPVIPLERLPDLATVATVVQGGADVATVDASRVALLIGGEAAGLPADVVDSADYRVTISTPGPTESLNAAVAAGILVHALSNR